MKKIAALLLAVVLLCSCAAALAETPPMPSLEEFASMVTWTEKGVLYITLGKPVDKLYLNYPNDLRIVELGVTQNLTSAVYIDGQFTQPGVALDVTILNARCGAKNRLVGTVQDRALITVQGQWIVCYNRKGQIVNVSYLGDTFDIQAVRDVAFSQHGKSVFNGYGLYKWVDGKKIIVPAF